MSTLIDTAPSILPPFPDPVLLLCFYMSSLTQDGTVYTGRFEGGRPKGEGKFEFPTGITQLGFYEVVAAEEDADEDEPPALLWRGQSIVAC